MMCTCRYTCKHTRHTRMLEAWLPRNILEVRCSEAMLGQKQSHSSCRLFLYIPHKNSNLLCHSSPPIYVSHKFLTHLSHKCPIPTSPLCLINFTLHVCAQIFQVMNINVLLVLPHLTHKCLHTSSEIIDLAEYVLNRLIHQANEDQPVEYNFDILEDQEHHDNHILVWMVSNYIGVMNIHKISM